jgi:FkbM family methyltransferase
MALINTFRFIISHPLNRNNKLGALLRWVGWQIRSRLASGPLVVNFVNEAKLLVTPGMTGATGNIYCGLHEFEPMAFVLHMLRKGDLFVDVGANIGSYTVLAGAVIGARCISIEPIPETYEDLMQNIRINGIENIIRAYNCGIGKEDGVLRFTVSLDTADHVAVATERNAEKTIQVEIKKLDTIIGNLKPALMKIDVEGYETEVIASADDILSQPTMNAVIMELDGYGRRYGFDETLLHRRMIAYDFAPCSYSPFDRKLIVLDDNNKRSGNNLYIKKQNIDSVRERLFIAPPLYINGTTI